MPNSEDILEIKDLDHFVGMLTRWHTHKVAVLKHMLEVPRDAEVTLNDGVPRKLDGPFRDGFELGVTLALSELGKLPFVAEMEEATDAVKH